MTAPYYNRDRVPLKFTISGADGGITLSKVIILKPNNVLTDEAEAAVDGDTVSYNVPGSVNSRDGTYRAYFVNTLSSGGERTHKIEYEVILNPERWPIR